MTNETRIKIEDEINRSQSVEHLCKYINKKRKVYVVKKGQLEVYRVTTIDKSRDKMLSGIITQLFFHPFYDVYENDVLIHSKKIEKPKEVERRFISTETRQIYNNIDEAIEDTGKARMTILNHLRASKTTWAKFRYL